MFLLSDTLLQVVKAVCDNDIEAIALVCLRLSGEEMDARQKQSLIFQKATFQLHSGDNSGQNRITLKTPRHYWLTLALTDHVSVVYFVQSDNKSSTLTCWTDRSSGA